MKVEQRFQKRQVAHKIRIKDILGSKYNKTEGLNPNYLGVNGQEVSRFNIICVVVQKSEINGQEDLIIDDGSGEINARTFENELSLININVGDVVLIIGRPREFTTEKYVLIEIIKKVNTMWAKARKLELEKNTKPLKVVSEKGASKDIVENISPKNKIIKIIKELDDGGGTSIEDIASKDKGNVDKVVGLLLKEGDVFEVRPGKLKVLE